MIEELIETIVDGLEIIALIIRAGYDKPGVQFFTPTNFSQQVAFIRHSKGKKISPHIHNLIFRQVIYTQEVLIIRQGKVKVDLFTSQREFIVSRILETGDVIILCAGGHSFDILEDTAMIEVKQGPYAGEQDKTIFEVR